ncbi:hypothetical protein HF086_016052 [Spodoptera exigua]|uniref:SUN domain-containing protein n=1 Tax=Spodoptera exigua TaxID=7107 RepID=A0A922MN40_SPOEX|nr:hypothetical protein HF086_016052 [Spodoptera exigua]
MSRRSLSQFRVQGPNTSVDEIDRLSATTSWTTSTVRRRYTSIDSSDDETTYPHRNGGAYTAEQRWWITRLLITMITSITTTTRNTYRKMKYIAQSYQGKAGVKKRWWPWLLLLILPAMGYGSHYTYENWERLAMPNFTDFRLDLSEFSAIKIPEFSLPNITLPSLDVLPKIKMPEINITLPDIRENLPEVKKTYIEYRDIVQNRMADVSDYIVVVADSCFEEIKKTWRDYNYGESTAPAEQLVVDTYKPPQILQDPDLSKRVAALEDWAVNVDTRLKYFDQKLSRLDNLEAQIEHYSLKYLQQNLIQVFNENDNAGVLAAKLKEYFDKDYVSKEQMQAMSQEIHERLISTWKPDMDEDRIREIVQEYLAVFERRQMEIIVERMKEYVKELEVQTVHTGIDIESVKRIVAGMLDVYDADKTGLGLHGEMDPDPHLFGDYQYDANGTAIQYFPVKYPKTTNIGGVEYPVAYDIIELRVESNHGNPTYTCVYRFRVHGNPLSDIRRATEDSIKDSET